MIKADSDQPIVPARAVLLIEQDEVAHAVGAGWQARGLQRDQCHQRMHAGSAHGRSRYQPRQPQRLEAKVVADEVFTLMRVVAFVEHEVKDLEDGVEAADEFKSAGQVERQSFLADLPLGAYQTLRDGAFVSEKSTGDLADTEAADGLEAEGDAGFGRELGMAAHEDHA